MQMPTRKCRSFLGGGDRYDVETLEEWGRCCNQSHHTLARQFSDRPQPSGVFCVRRQSALANAMDRANSGQVCIRKKWYTGHNPAPARINSFPGNGANSKIARYAKGSKPGTQKRLCAGWTDWPPILPDRRKQADKVPLPRMDGVTG